MRQRLLKISTLLLLTAFTLCAPSLRAATVTGTVTNGTSGKPAAGVDILLIELQAGMKTVANAKTGPDGKYSLENPSSGPMPMLIRAVYRGVNFHQPLPPGQSSADVTVFDPTSDPKTLKFGTRVLMFQPNGESLMVVDEYSLQNTSQPPLAFYNAAGNFDFDLPEGAENPQVSSWGPSRMPVNQGTITKGKGKYAIAYAFQPGDNGVRVSYQVPYTGDGATLKLVSTHGVDRVGLIVPQGVQVKSTGFTAQGQEQGYNLYSRDAIQAGQTFEVSLAGTAPLPTAEPGDGEGSRGPSGTGGSAAVLVLPNRLESVQYMLLGGFVILFGLGVFSLWRRPVTAGIAPQPPPVPPVDPARSRGARKKAQVDAPVATTPVYAPAPSSAPVATMEAPATVSSVTRDVEMSLDSLKDRLFRLELRRQAGTVTEEEYMHERAQAEKVLRELVGR